MNEFVTNVLFLSASALPLIKYQTSIEATKDIKSPDSFSLKYYSDEVISKKIDMNRLGQESEYNPFSEIPEGSVIIIPITGLMQKYNGWTPDWRYVIGMDYYAELIRYASKCSNVSGIVLKINSPGGTNTSLIQLESALRERTKPCVALIDGVAMSAGYYIASFADLILAENPMSQVGSIGAMGQLIDNSKALENAGLKKVIIYPPESSWKNKTYDKALSGDTELLISEDLTPLAIHFQNIIKKNRKKLDTSVDGILEGREFYADAAIKHKLLDGYGNISDAVDYINKVNDERNSIINLY